MDLALNNLQRLICHKTKQTKPNQIITSLSYIMHLVTLLLDEAVNVLFHANSQGIGMNRYLLSPAMSNIVRQTFCLRGSVSFKMAFSFCSKTYTVTPASVRGVGYIKELSHLLEGGMLCVTFIVVGNGISDPSSIPGRGCLHFTFC